MSASAEGLWDSHAHVIGDPARYPLAQLRGYHPARRASVDEYLALLDRLGLDRGALVQPSFYGFDNRCMLDAIDQAPGRLVGVAVPAPDSSPADLEALARRGVVGVRCNLVNAGGLDLETVIGWQPVLRDLGWHVAIQLAVEAMPDLRARIERFDVTVVIDHMGRPSPGSADPDSADLQPLIRLVAEGACLVKLSAPYRLSNQPPPWRDVAPLARALLAANPEACRWASDWPHTDTHQEVQAEDLVEALGEWCPDVEQRRMLMAGI